MTHFSKLTSMTVLSLASALLGACGGGDAGAPPPPVGGGGVAAGSGAIDSTPPTVTIANDTPAPTATGPVNFTFVFSEDVGVSFDATDVVVTGGTPSDFLRISGSQATVKVTPTANVAGSMSVSVAAGSFADITGNANTAAASTSKNYAAAPPPPPPPVGAGTVIANFDTVLATDVPDTNGGTGSISATPPAGGSGSAYALLRSGGATFALGLLNASVPFTADRKTLSARVYSPTAGIPIVLKLENRASAGGITTGDTQANEAVVAGWQTLTWTFTSADPTKTYDFLVLLPNLGTVDAPPGKTYYFDDIKLLAATGGGAITPPADQGSGGPQALTLATGDVLTGDGGNTMFVAGEALFAVNYVGSAEATTPFNLAAYPNAKSANFGGITGISGGDIGFFQDDVNLSNAPQKVAELGWVTGTSWVPLGVPNFFRTFVLSGPVSNSAFMGLFVNAPNNGTVNVSSFGKIKIKVWGPGPMFERTNFNPVLEVTLTGPKVAGCTTGSGGSEITQNLTANLKNGAGGFYTLPLSGFTVKGLCGTDSGAANVLANLARVVVTVPGTSFNYTNLDGGNYATGLNLGPVGFTNQ